MARRSAMNERYQKNSLPPGKTRKSAAAAKPKRTASSGSTTSSSSSKGSSAKKREPLVMHPDTPEYKKWRRIWWACLVVAIVLSTVSWFVLRGGDANRTAGMVVLGAAYAAIAAALVVDWTRLRKIRAAWMAEQEKPTSKSAAKKAEKAAKAEAETTADESETPDDGDTES